MFKNILVPIDPGHLENAETALDTAEQLLAGDGKLTLVSVIEDIPSYVAAQIPTELLESARKDANDKLHSVIKDRKADADIIVAGGHAASTIKKLQIERECDLIVISSHKPTSLDFLLGSTASSVVRGAQCCVFVMR